MGEPSKHRKYGRTSDEADPRHKSSKDTKRWCRGKIGVEHRKHWHDTADTYRTRFNLPYYEVLSCIECGREFERNRKRWTIQQVIQSVRQAQGLTQAELGEKSGMQQERISAVELGQGDITMKTLKRLCQALNLTVDIHFYDCGDVRISQEER